MTSLLPIEIALNVFVVFLFFIYWSIVFIILYHLTRFGIGVQPKRFAAVFLFGSIILFTASILLYANMNVGELMQMI